MAKQCRKLCIVLRDFAMNENSTNAIHALLQMFDRAKYVYHAFKVPTVTNTNATEGLLRILQNLVECTKSLIITERRIQQRKCSYLAQPFS